MATYDLTRTQLDAALSHNFDAQTRAAIIDYLNDAHAFDPKVTVDNQPFGELERGHLQRPVNIRDYQHR